MSKLRLPATLAFVIVSAGGAIAACDSDGGKTADAGQDCSYTCVPDSSGDGGPMGDAGCPMCADQNHECPSGCIPLSLA
jgi:hypothetical protein